eukprot:SAG11_NODE_1700_length_4412_cov_3.622803_4_plen_201_part_00
MEWTCEEVAEWVLTLADQLGAESAAGVAAKVADEEIDGEAILSYERTDLKDDLGLKSGAFTKLWKALDSLRAEPMSKLGAVGSPRSRYAGRIMPALPSEPADRQRVLQSLLDKWHGGRWALQKELGSGASGYVWRATDSRLIAVAIKFVKVSPFNFLGDTFVSKTQCFTGGNDSPPAILVPRTLLPQRPTASAPECEHAT